MGGDLIYGGRGTDFLFGGAGSDKVLGGGGGDFISGDAGNDDLDGGAGNCDEVFYSGGPREAPGPVTMDLGAGTATGWGNDTLRGFEW